MKTIVEVGAYTGIETSRFLEDPDCYVYAFEPDKAKFAELSKKRVIISFVRFWPGGTISMVDECGDRRIQ